MISSPGKKTLGVGMESSARIPFWVGMGRVESEFASPFSRRPPPAFACAPCGERSGGGGGDGNEAAALAIMEDTGTWQ